MSFVKGSEFNFNLYQYAIQQEMAKGLEGNLDDKKITVVKGTITEKIKLLEAFDKLVDEYQHLAPEEKISYYSVLKERVEFLYKHLESKDVGSKHLSKKYGQKLDQMYFLYIGAVGALSKSAAAKVFSPAMQKFHQDALLVQSKGSPHFSMKMLPDGDIRMSISGTDKLPDRFFNLHLDEKTKTIHLTEPGSTNPEMLIGPGEKLSDVLPAFRDKIGLEMQEAQKLLMQSTAKKLKKMHPSARTDGMEGQPSRESLSEKGLKEKKVTFFGAIGNFFASIGSFFANIMRRIASFVTGIFAGKQKDVPVKPIQERTISPLEKPLENNESNQIKAGNASDTISTDEDIVKKFKENIFQSVGIEGSNGKGYSIAMHGIKPGTVEVTVIGDTKDPDGIGNYLILELNPKTKTLTVTDALTNKFMASMPCDGSVPTALKSLMKSLADTLYNEGATNSKTGLGTPSADLKSEKEIKKKQLQEEFLKKLQFVNNLDMILGSFTYQPSKDDPNKVSATLLNMNLPGMPSVKCTLILNPETEMISVNFENPLMKPEKIPLDGNFHSALNAVRKYAMQFLIDVNKAQVAAAKQQEALKFRETMFKSLGGEGYSDVTIGSQGKCYSSSSTSSEPDAVIVKIFLKDQKPGAKSHLLKVKLDPDLKLLVVTDNENNKYITSMTYNGSIPHELISLINSMADSLYAAETASSPSLEKQKIDDFKKEWEKNKKASLGGSTSTAFNNSSQLLTKMVSDSSISDEAVLKFLQDIHIKPSGGFFTSGGKPTALADLLSQLRPKVYASFTGKPAMVPPPQQPIINPSDSKAGWAAVTGAQPSFNQMGGKPLKHNFTTEQIDQWLFGKKAGPAPGFPQSKLAINQNGVRMKDKSAPKTALSTVKMLSDAGKYTSRMAVCNAGVTDFKGDPGQKVAVCDSNNGDLLTGCGYAIATAVINAAGPNLQKDLYNQFGVPGVMEVPEGAKEYTQKAYGGSEGRGYSITCDAHDMKASHNISRIEFMTVPMHDEAGLRNMYKEAFEHSKDLDYIVVPMAGMSHPVLTGKPDLSAKIATEEFQKFVDLHPESKLKVVFTIYQDHNSEDLYKAAASKLDAGVGVGLQAAKEIEKKQTQQEFIKKLQFLNNLDPVLGSFAYQPSKDDPNKVSATIINMNLPGVPIEKCTMTLDPETKMITVDFENPELKQEKIPLDGNFQSALDAVRTKTMQFIKDKAAPKVKDDEILKNSLQKGVNKPAAMNLLKDQPSGTYMIRESQSTAGSLVIAFYSSANTYTEILLRPKAGGGYNAEQIAPPAIWHAPFPTKDFNTLAEVFETPLLKAELKKPFAKSDNSILNEAYWGTPPLSDLRAALQKAPKGSYIIVDAGGGATGTLLLLLLFGNKRHHRIDKRRPRSSARWKMDYKRGNPRKKIRKLERYAERSGDCGDP